MELRLLVAVLLLSLAYGDTNYRLNTPIVPSNYRINLTPYFDTNDAQAFTFDGEVVITFTTTNATNQIKFHSNDLNFTVNNIALTPNINFDATNPLQFNTSYDFVFLNLQNELQVGTTYNLRIVYSGPIRTDLNGFYRNFYMEGGIKKWVGATQMEPTHARKVFPCFDEPGLKATFDLVISRPASYKPSLSNMKIMTTENIANNMVRETFYTTPIMPTYLVAFIISEFDVRSTDDSFGVYTRPEALNQTQFAFDFGENVVNQLGNYFGIDYYSSNEHLKLDHVALPDFRAGAMENWGLVTYRESLLLYVPGESMPYYKYRVAQILAHETTHMWFGNLVTCHWWSDTWLNEGFANYFQDYITSVIEPDLGSDDILVTGSMYAAYDADNAPTSPPISNEDVNSPAEISGHFGTITYQKAGSVIRMIHHLVGDEAFKFGLNSYLNASKFSSGYPDRLYEGLNAGVTTTNALSIYPGATIKDIMISWINQAGHPIVTVNVDYENQIATLTQSRFYINSSHTSEQEYKIPITYTTKVSPNFSNTKPVFILEDKTQNISLNGSLDENSWTIFNIQETGLYRVNYDDNTWRKIAQALSGDDRRIIHHLNRAKIVNDLFAFFYADVVNFDRVHEVLEFLKVEDDYSVWFAALRGLKKLRNSYLGTDALESIEQYALGLMENIISVLGYMPRTDDSFETLRNRLQLLEFACEIGHEECTGHMVQMFKEFKEYDTEVPASLRSVVYCNGLRFGDGSDYDFLWNRMLTTNVANEARTILEVLGCTSDVVKMKEYLSSVLVTDSPIRTQDLTSPLASILTNSSHASAVLNNLDCTQWSSVYPSMETILTTIASALRFEEDINHFEAILDRNECDATAINSARTVLAQLAASASWAEDHKDEVLKTVRSGVKLTVPSLSILTLAIGAFVISY
ncbi:membrane alanyl aminopeptidase-like [Plodia interpunctella]|uniref:membrane alanyl aminopeptidase-like n=1 Tax=Plodia interpunctella TaxID=58824 RepID=UPI002367CE25|nr:membrane alanyl aminopeptidase-like [Plodia interpunctella]